MLVSVQVLKSGPAFAGASGNERVMRTSSMLVGQGPFEMVQRKKLGPRASPATAVLGLLGVMMVPEPKARLQLPVPVVGALALRIATESQTVWSGPALEVLAGEKNWIVTRSLETGQMPFVICHCKV